MNSETLGLLFMATQIEIFSTRFNAFETEFTAKISLGTFLTIYMALSQRLTQVGKDPYLLELSELHQIGVHAWPSPGRATLLLAPSKTNSPIGRNPGENTLSLSLKIKSPSYCIVFPFLHVFGFSNVGDDHYSKFCLIISLNFHLIPSMSSSLGFLTLGTISVIHFHPLSTHTTCVTRVHVIGNFFHITCLSNPFYGTRHPVPRKT